MHSKFAENIELLRSSIIVNHTKLQDDVSTLSTKVNDLHSYYLNLQDKICNLNSQVVQPPPTSHSTINTIKELEDCNRRKCNIIVHKLPESATNSDDQNTFSSICKDILNLDVKVNAIKRLGQRRERAHLLLVELESEGIKKQILARSRKLRQTDLECCFYNS